MAYTAPRTWVTGELVTGALLNEQIRDNTLAEFPVGVDAWATWSPTLTNLTLGNGTILAKYHKIGRTVHFRFRFTLGSTSAVGSAPEFTLPVAGSSDLWLGDNIGTMSFSDSSATFYAGIALMLSATTVRIRYINTAAALPSTADVNATTPFTWGVSDMIFCTATYESAT